MAHASVSGRARGELGALVIRQLLREPGAWSARALSAELGEAGPRRVQKIVAELEAAGWTVSRNGGSNDQRITIAP